MKFRRGRCRVDRQLARSAIVFQAGPTGGKSGGANNFVTAISIGAAGRGGYGLGGTFRVVQKYCVSIRN